MHYPIDAAAHITAIQEQFKGRERLAEFCRNYLIPAMNDAYQDGRAGASGYMQDPAAEIAAFERDKGPVSAQGKRRIEAFIHCLNTAYAQGQRDAMGTGQTA